MSSAGITSVGSIGNYYGGLEIKTEDGSYFWGIENWNGCAWQEIPEDLYEALLKFASTQQTT